MHSKQLWNHRIYKALLQCKCGISLSSSWKTPGFRNKVDEDQQQLAVKVQVSESRWRNSQMLIQQTGVCTFLNQSANNKNQPWVISHHPHHPSHFPHPHHPIPIILYLSSYTYHLSPHPHHPSPPSPMTSIFFFFARSSFGLWKRLLWPCDPRRLVQGVDLFVSLEKPGWSPGDCFGGKHMDERT